MELMNNWDFKRKNSHCTCILL